MHGLRKCLGDGIQAMKAGLIEIADVLIVNKADREGAERTLQQLLGAQSIRASDTALPVLKTTAITGAGVPEMAMAIAAAGARAHAAAPQLRRRRRARYLIARAAADIIARRVREGGEGPLEALADEVLAGRITAEAAALRLLEGAS